LVAFFRIVEEVLSEKLIKVSEAAEKIGVSLVTVKRMIIMIWMAII